MRKIFSSAAAADSVPALTDLYSCDIWVFDDNDVVVVDVNVTSIDIGGGGIQTSGMHGPGCMNHPERSRK